jgi:hypothetical protein
MKVKAQTPPISTLLLRLYFEAVAWGCSGNLKKLHQARLAILEQQTYVDQGP